MTTSTPEKVQQKLKLLWDEAEVNVKVKVKENELLCELVGTHENVDRPV